MAKTVQRHPLCFGGSRIKQRHITADITAGCVDRKGIVVAYLVPPGSREWQQDVPNPEPAPCLQAAQSAQTSGRSRSEMLQRCWSWNEGTANYVTVTPRDITHLFLSSCCSKNWHAGLWQGHCWPRTPGFICMSPFFRLQT